VPDKKTKQQFVKVNNPSMPMPGEMNAPCCSQVEKGAQGRIKSGAGNWS